MKIELTPAEAMVVYDAITEAIVTDHDGRHGVCLEDARYKIRCAIIDDRSNIDAFEKWYKLQQAKVDALGAKAHEGDV